MSGAEPKRRFGGGKGNGGKMMNSAGNYVVREVLESDRTPWDDCVAHKTCV